MSRRLRRLLLPAAALCLLAGLTACGDDEKKPSSSSSDSPSGGSSSSAAPADDAKALDALTVKGDFAQEPTVTFSKEVTVSDIATKTLITGKGETLADDGSALAHVWVGDGATKKKVLSTYDDKAQLVTLGTSLLPALNKAMAGQTVGSRVLVASSPANAYGDQGNTSLGIGNADTVIFIVDILSGVPTEPSGSAAKPAVWAPKITETDGKPSALDFTGVPKPTATTSTRTFLVKGDGPVTKKGQQAYVNYLGQVYAGDAPFDASYTRGTPFDFELGTGGKPGGPIKGWDAMITGVPVGSRLIIRIPPGEGYGKPGNSGAGITGTDTIYFVVDVLAAA